MRYIHELPRADRADEPLLWYLLKGLNIARIILALMTVIFIGLIACGVLKIGGESTEDASTEEIIEDGEYSEKSSSAYTPTIDGSESEKPVNVLKEALVLDGLVSIEILRLDRDGFLRVVCDPNITLEWSDALEDHFDFNLRGVDIQGTVSSGIINTVHAVIYDVDTSEVQKVIGVLRKSIESVENPKSVRSVGITHQQYGSLEIAEGTLYGMVYTLEYDSMTQTLVLSRSAVK